MNTAFGSLRSVLLGAFGGLAAYALAAALGLAPAQRPEQGLPRLWESALQPVADLEELAPHEAVARRFVAATAATALYDAQAARLMQQRSRDEAVRALAQAVLQQHERTWPALQALAAQHAQALPHEPGARQRAALALLAGAAEGRGERLFVRQFGLDATLAEIARLEATLQAPLAREDAALRAWIGQSLAALHERAALARRLLPPQAARRPMA
jgi:predicted outer membrane protein